MICGKCGENSPDGTKFCINCGEKLGGSPKEEGLTCSVCGCHNSENAVYCKKCGHRLSELFSHTMPVQAQQSLPSGGYYAQAHPSSDTILVRELCSSGSALVFAIAYTLATCLGVYYNMNGSYLGSLLYELGLGSYARLLGNTSLLSAIISMLPSVLITMGLWITYASAKSSPVTAFKTSGLTIIKVIEMIRVILSVVAAFVVVILAVAANDYFGSSGDLAFIVLFVVIIAEVIIFTYYFGLYKAAQSLTLIARSSQFYKKVSILTIIYVFIVGVVSGISVFVTYGTIGKIMTLSSAVAYITLGVFLVSCRSKISNFQYINNQASQHQAMYTNPSAAYVPMQGNYVPAQYAQAVRESQTSPLRSNNAVKCVECGTEVALGSKFCGKCGSEIVVETATHKKRFCNSCGSQIIEGNAFCNNCGAKLDE